MKKHLIKKRTYFLAISFFLWLGTISFASPIFNMSSPNFLPVHWWHLFSFEQVPSIFEDSFTVLTADDLDLDNDGIPNSIENQDCLGVGLIFEFYDGVPDGQTTDNIPTTGALATGIVKDFNVKNLQELVDPGDTAFYSIRYSGLLYTPTTGMYTFTLFSDDGSQIFIDNTLVVDRDVRYLSGDTPISGSIYLTEGFHSFKALYFDLGGNQFLDIDYEGPGISKQEIPSHAFSTGQTVLNSITNGDFELDLFNGDWDVSPGRSGNGWKNEDESSPVQYGRAHLPANSLNTLATLSTVVGVLPDTDSRLFFDLGTRASNSDNNAVLNVYINNELKATYTSDEIHTLAGGDTDINDTDKNMVTQSIAFNSPSTSVFIAITGQGSVATGYHDRLFVDNVYVSPQATCNDQDGDGIINSLDLDSDNDGIFDAVEAGHGAAHVNGVVTGAVGEDGIPDAVQTAGVLNYTILNTDSDSDPDYLDLDSDSDSCPDVVEAGFTQSGVEPGFLSGTGVDTNGAISGNSDGYTLPLDADLNGIKDYMQTGGLAVISLQPVATQLCVGNSFNLSVNATSGYQYQWQYNAGNGWLNVSNTSNISGANTASLTISSATHNLLQVEYRVLVLNGAYLCGSQVSSNEVLVGTKYCTAVTNRRITYRATH
ncbi:PA14 domain-containing protein [Flavobacteriaceae bacterium]|nr:PA14 domain-containing protein [Flavobacteriaceae bacterium]